MTVKLLLLDEEDRLLLIHGRDPRTGDTHWYPVGGGVEPGESAHRGGVPRGVRGDRPDVAPSGAPVWTRDHTYEFDGRTKEVHEDWFLHEVHALRSGSGRHERLRGRQHHRLPLVAR